MANGATLKDVARAAGVHISTASRALNAETRALVNVETAGRVLATAERLRYRPHPLALGLKTNRTHTIGMVVSDLISPFTAPILAGAQRALSEVGYSLLIGADTDKTTDHTRTAVETFLDRRVDGLIVANARLDFAPPEPLLDHEVPTVLVNRSVRGDSFPAIVGDEHIALTGVVRHLIELGHTRIAHVAGPQHVSTGLYRRMSFVEALTTSRLDTSLRSIFEAGSFRMKDGYDAAQAALDSGLGFTAIVAANDLLALGCIDAIQERGLDVPGDISVTGYDDILLVDRLEPPLTTVSSPYEEMGASAAQMLVGMLGGQYRGIEPPYEPIRLAPSLVVRSSSGPVSSK